MTEPGVDRLRSRVGEQTANLVREAEAGFVAA